MLRNTLLIVTALSWMASCSGGSTDQQNTPDGPSGAAGPRDMLVYSGGTDIESLLSPVQSTASDRFVSEQLSMPVVGSSFDCTLKREQGGLAKEWDWNDEGTILSMTLRDDIQWADGTPVTAHDLAFTYDLVANPAVASPRMGFVDKMTEEGRPKVVDATHLEWHFTNAYDRDTQTVHTGLTPVPKHLLKEADAATLRGHKQNLNPMPNGYFKLEEHKPKQHFILAPNDKYTGPAETKPKIKRVMFKIVPEYQTRLLQLKKGETDLMDGLRVKDADELRKSNPNIKLMRRGYRFLDYIAWNLNDPLFQDKRVRQAFAHAVDINRMIDKLLTSETGERYAKVAVSTITPELCAAHNNDIKPFAYNIERAKELLAEAGWTDTDGDGWVDKDGVTMEFTLVTNRENERRIEASVLAQESMKAIGVNMKLDQMEFNAMSEASRKKQFQAMLSGWSAGLSVDPSSIWHSDANGKSYPFNFTSYANPAVDVLIDRGLSTPNPADAAPIWNEMQALIYDDQPYLFLWWRDEIVGIDNRFENVQLNILSLFYRLNEWEVPPDKVKHKF